MFWMVLPFGIALMNFIVIGIMHLSNAKRAKLNQPFRLITYDFIVTSTIFIAAMGTGLLFRVVTGLNDLPSLLAGSAVALVFNLFYIIKLRDNIWFNIINEEKINVENTAIKVVTLPKIFNFMIPSSNTDVSIYVANKGLIVDKDFYHNTSDILKKYVSHIAMAFNKSAISSRLFSHLLLGQVMLVVVLLTTSWVSDNLSVDAVIESGFTTTEMLILAAYFVSLVSTVYSLFMIGSLYSWQWTFAEKNLANTFSEDEIRQIQDEIERRNLKVNGYYNILKWSGYTPKPT